MCEVKSDFATFLHPAEAPAEVKGYMKLAEHLFWFTKAGIKQRLSPGLEVNSVLMFGSTSSQPN